MTVRRQLSYHCPSVVATLKQVELFVWQQGMLGGRERRLFISERDGRREYARNVAPTEYRSGKKVSELNKKRDFESRSLAGKMAVEEIESPCRQVVGDKGLTRLL